MIIGILEIVKEIAVIIGALVTIFGGLTMFSKTFRKRIQCCIKALFKEEFNKIDALNERMEEVFKLNEQQSEAISEIGMTQGLLVKAMKDNLRENLNGTFYKYEERGEVPQYERERAKIAYEDYRSLNGNSYMEDMFERFLSIPIEKKKKG